MKRYLFLASMLLSAAGMQAQQDLNTASDAVRFSMDNLTGTARFRAMSGAFGALGGDMSAINVNPAGAAVFNYNTGTASLTSYNISNKISYLGNKTRENYNTFDLNQLGAIFVFNTTNENATFRKFTLGFNYENTNDFDNRIFSAGINQANSISSYFLNYANGIPLSTLQDNFYYEDLTFAEQQAYLGYNAYIFNPVANTGGNTLYTLDDNIANSPDYYQESNTAISGFNGKVALNFATQYQSWLYLGLNLNIHFTDYIKTNTIYEDYNGSSSTGLQSIRFNNERYTYGGGFSFNLGAIAKVTEALRLGLSVESPTWYSLQDEITQSISAYCPDCGTGGSNTIITDPGITMILDDYSLTTPGKLTGSLAYVFNKSGLISVDAGLKDYSTTRFGSGNYGVINNELDNTLGIAKEIRVGAEYRYKSVSFRGGARYEESPYKNNNTVSDLKGFSGGLGFAFGNSRLDLAYSYYKRSVDMPVLNAGGAFNEASRVRSDNNNITLSYSIDL